MFDTHEHEEYFREHYRPSAPATVLEVGVDEEVFCPGAPTVARQDDFEVLFYGTYIPLHGIETILDAAHALKDREGLRFTLIGHGQEYDAMRRRADALELDNVRFVDPMPPTELAEHIRRADVCLGIFGTSRKAGSVVPNKVVQCAAMAKPMITRDSTAVRRYFQDGDNVRLVPAADAESLARAVDELQRDADARGRIGRAARSVFEEHFSAEALRPKLLRILQANGA